MKKSFAFFWLSLLLTCVGVTFWKVQWVYSLPTPVPAEYKNVSPGTFIDVSQRAEFKNDKPLFLHFYNPDCPCSKFNVPHFKSLVKQYGAQINFAIVPLGTTPVTEEEIRERFDLPVPVLQDTSLATQCGVYSTPQAVILNADRSLYFRGNYNRARYCDDKRTEYARIAIEAILSNNQNIVYDPIALKAYGCQIPMCGAKPQKQ